MGKTGLIVALDHPDLEAAEDLAAQLSDSVAAFKVGLTLFSAFGPESIARIARHGKVFCDLKLHDIPHQVGQASAELARRSVWMFTVHASGGPSMVRAAANAANQANPSPPLVAAVTVLTAMSADELIQIGQGGDIQSQVVGLAKMAASAGATAIVCSALHLKQVRAEVGDDLILVTPGIRAAGEAAGDQVQTAAAAQASADGADFVVVGRPITGATDPVAAAKRISTQL